MENLTFDDFRKKYGLLVGSKINKVGGAKIFLIKLPDRNVALKKTAYADSSTTEIEIHRQLSSICQDFVPIFFDSCITSGYVYIAMEFCKFGSLYEFAKDCFGTGLKVLPASDFAEILVQMLQCIHFLHSNNIAHRDIKTDNFLITECGLLKLCDFGFSRAVDKIPREFCGTCDYVAPEIVNQVISTKYPIAGIESDVWAFGISAYELAYACTPWDERGYHEISKILLEIGKLAFQKDVIYFEMHKKDISELDLLLKDLLLIDQTKRPTVAQLFLEKPHFLKNYLKNDFCFLKNYLKNNFSFF